MPRRRNRKQKSVVASPRLAGCQLRRMREALGMSLRDVATESTRIAALRRNKRFQIQVSRLHDFETRGRIPSIYRLYSLASIYGRSLHELLAWYGVDAG